MELISIVQKELFVQNSGEVLKFMVIETGKGEYDSLTQKITFNVNQSPYKECWRLVYDTKRLITYLFKSGGITETIWNMYCGTEEECRDEAKKRGLIIKEADYET